MTVQSTPVVAVPLRITEAAQRKFLLLLFVDSVNGYKIMARTVEVVICRSAHQLQASFWPAVAFAMTLGA